MEIEKKMERQMPAYDNKAPPRHDGRRGVGGREGGRAGGGVGRKERMMEGEGESRVEMRMTMRISFSSGEK